MARKQRTSKKTKELFRDPSGQPDLFEKSYQEELEARAKNQVECLGMTFENDEARRAYFLEKLKEKLKDPGFRKIEGFPIGSDEDILALSDPPYYTACPNPFIEDFIRCYGKPYDSKTDKYRQEPFAADTSAGKFDPIYRAHSYHTKVPYLAIQEYLFHYTEPGDCILDLFCGTGMTGAAARLMDDGSRHSILVDLSPEASFIAGAMINVHNYQKVKSEHQKIGKELYSSTKQIYSGLIDPPSGDVNYTVWSDVFICPECTSEIVYWNAAVDIQTGDIKSTILCSKCNSELCKDDLIRCMESFTDVATGIQIRQTKTVPVLLDLTIDGRRIQRRPLDRESKRIREINPMEFSSVFPTNEMMFVGEKWGDSWRAGYHKGFSRVHHFYERRSIAALGKLYSLILESNERNSLLFMLSGMLPRASRLHKWKKGQTTGITTGTLYVPSLRYEYNINKMWKERIAYAFPVISCKKDRNHIVSTQSSTQLKNIPNESADYIFVDPPFGDNLMYSELNFIWESWLHVFTNRLPEAIISASQNKGLNEYLDLMSGVLTTRS